MCSNKANAFAKPTLDCYYALSRATYHSLPCPEEEVSYLVITPLPGGRGGRLCQPCGPTTCCASIAYYGSTTH